MISRNEVSVKTTLAPNAPWYKLEKPLPKHEVRKRTHRAKPSEIDKKFEEWLSTIERIK